MQPGLDGATVADRLATAAAGLAAATSPVEACAALGLVVPASTAAPPPMPPVAVDLGGALIEAWAFRAGLKPVAFVTVAADRVAATRAQFAGAHVEERHRQVAIGPGDRWDDRRDRGAPRVELYCAREPALARRAATLQADDPTRHLGELGELLGYPRCCIDAFAAQRDRANNSLNRYLAAARTGDDGPWPWPLNELHVRLISFYPCSYRCPRALDLATATLDAIDAAHPGTRTRAERALARTVVYLDHDHQLWLGGAGTATAVGRGDHLAPLVALAADADQATLTADALTLCAAGAVRARVPRTAPALGAVLRFA